MSCIRLESLKNNRAERLFSVSESMTHERHDQRAVYAFSYIIHYLFIKTMKNTILFRRLFESRATNI